MNKPKAYKRGGSSGPTTAKSDTTKSKRKYSDAEITRGMRAKNVAADSAAKSLGVRKMPDGSYGRRSNLSGMDVADTSATRKIREARSAAFDRAVAPKPKPKAMGGVMGTARGRAEVVKKAAAARKPKPVARKSGGYGKKKAC
jgi:hypothetical protein